MTDSQNNDVEDLPTALCQKVNYTASDGTMKEKLKLELSQKFKAELKDGDKLYRGKDVKTLIQEAVKHELEKARDSLLIVTDKGGGVDRYRERLQEGLTYRIENLEVEELLEELEQ